MENQEKSRVFKKGMIVYAISKKDDQWHRAKIQGIHYQSLYPTAALHQKT